MARSSLAQNTCNWITALLTLWSMVSLIVIVVWATWPPLASLAQCRAAHQALNEKMEGAKVIKEKEQDVLKSALLLSSKNQTRLQEELEGILERQRETNTSLTESLQLQVVLKENATALEKQRLMHHSEHARLFSELAQQEALLDILWVNLTSESHHVDWCAASRDAARSQQGAAESQRKACETKTTYLLKQLENCKVNGRGTEDFQNN